MLKDLLPLLKDTTTNKNIHKTKSYRLVLNFETVLTSWRSQLQATCSVGRSMKMCRSSRPGLIRALSKISALFVEARTITWSVVPIPAAEGEPNVSLVFLSQTHQQLWNLSWLLTVHLHQQLVERLLLFRVGEAGHVGGALLSHRVDLVDVNDAGGSRTSLFEQTADPRGTETCTSITAWVPSGVKAIKTSEV